MPTAPSIATLRDALTDPDTYPYEPESITLEQTHISLVALAPPWVYKIKKPVELGFLDFSTPEQRAHFCEEELRLNQRLAADTYVDVVPIVQTSDGLRIDPPQADGPVVEHAVKMRYLSPDQFLDARIRRGDATAQDIDRVADRLAAFYRARTSTPEVAEAGWIDALRVSFDENFAQTTEQVGHTLSRPAYDALRYYTDRTFDHHAALFHRRRAGGWIVDGHGDLRLEHVHLTSDRVAIYDCIEFNERFRHLDVANDLAFLAMDLDRHGRPDWGRRLIHRVADALGDDEMPRLIPFYKSYRAYVRGKVEGMRAADAEVPPDEQARSRRRAHRYFQWALRYALAGNQPLVIVVMGRPGTGKSTQAAALARTLGWAHLSSDRIRKARAGVSIARRADAATRERLYIDVLSDATYATLRTRAVERGHRDQGTVLDATYSSPERRAAAREAFQDAGLPHAFIELTAPDDTLQTRLTHREAEDAMGSDARAEDFDALSARYQAPTALEDPHHVRISTDGSTDETTLAILKALIRLRDP
jgi:hypothetical protein